MNLMSKFGECSPNIIQPYSWLDIMHNHELIVWLKWVNKNICQQLYTDTYITTGVKVRIATGMLNKIRSLTDMEGITIHKNHVDNLKKISIEIDLERLPF